MTIKHTRDCDTCKSGKPGTSWKQIGEELLVKGDRVSGDSSYRFYQCSDCGLVWREVYDIGGAGGSDGPFYKNVC